MAHNVLYVVPSLEVGGTSIQLALLARNLPRTTIRPHILCLEKEGDLADSVRKAGIPLECLGRSDPGFLRICQRVRWFCKDWDIDLVHCFLREDDLAAVRGARSAGVKAVMTSRREIPDRRTRRQIRAQKTANKKTDRIVCNSKAVRKFVCLQEKIPEENTTVIYNGFPEEAIPPEPLLAVRSPRRVALRSLMLDEDEKVLACIAPFVPVKNHFELLNAYRKVLLKGVKARLLLIGEGPLQQQVRDYAEENMMGPATEFLGKRLDRLKLLAECDGLILPSLNEGFPNVVLEAQALGIPVVASRKGGIPELVEHGRTGWLFDPEDSNSIAGAIWTVLLEREDAVRVAGAAQDQVRTRFTARNMVANYLGLYESLLGA